MDWEAYEDKGLVRKSAPDKELMKSLLKMSENKLEFLSRQTIDEKSASLILTLYYEALREVCEALASLKGFKIYSHEAITQFLKRNLSEDAASAIFDRYRKLRNGVNYYSRAVSSEETIKASTEIPALIARLKEKYFKSL
ncbi:hypothetical protein HYU12_02035 [Candidatus Woesearchaeota archaeon]|nr:hypothetical protein [Candidatus Woesearchaeota archaeon]